MNYIYDEDRNKTVQYLGESDKYKGLTEGKYYTVKYNYNDYNKHDTYLVLNDKMLWAAVSKSLFKDLEYTNYDDK